MSGTQAQAAAKPALKSSWVVWGGIARAGKTKETFSEGICEIFAFEGVTELAEFWKNRPYSRLSNVISVSRGDAPKRIEMNGKEYVFDSLSLFRKNIVPKWEDPQHARGSSLEVELLASQDQMDRIWQQLFMRLVGEDFPNSNLVTGLRIISRNRAEKNIRVELWLRVCKFDNQKTEGYTESNEELVDKLSKKMAEIITPHFPAFSESQIVSKDFKVSSKS